LRLGDTHVRGCWSTLRGGNLVIDGPVAETKEPLLGFYVIDVENLDAALDVAA
jgi:hypothetical protein